MLGKSVGEEFCNVVVCSKRVVVGFCEDNSAVDDDERYVVEWFCVD